MATIKVITANGFIGYFFFAFLLYHFCDWFRVTVRKCRIVDVNKISLGIKTLEERHSPINGKLSVKKDLAWGTYIKTSEITQSGGIAKKVWNSSLRKIRKSGIKKCLILGLGGGGMVGIIKKYWPQTKITGVEIDPIMVDLGKKYLGLKEAEVRIVIEDAMKFVKRQIKKKGKYDLILVDMYLGDTIPEKFTTPTFYNMTKKLLGKNGTIVFNRLYYDEKRKLADRTYQDLKKIFSRVMAVFPEANIMFICSKDSQN